ncbi:hypothetical protein ABW19_dt0204441 [Dactylella cylindrospora]|nr:hypothetical protein ABW19_dt0204441 [Dactylella cylindrospora]
MVVLMQDTTEPVTLNAIGREIKDLFQQVIAQLDEGFSDEETSRTQFAAEADRFALWAVNMGLFVPGHGSLDYRVREAENIKSMLTNFLTSLINSLREVLDYNSSESAISMKDTKDVPPDGSPDDETIEDGWGDTDDEGESDMELLLDSIKDPIDRLYKLSVWIRNPSSRFASSKVYAHKQVDSETGVDLLQAIEAFEVDYVHSVFLQYRRSKEQAENPKGKAIIEEEELHDAAFPRDKKGLLEGPESFLIQRLARANVRRRQQFSYWRNHHEKLALHTSTTDTLESKPHSTQILRLDDLGLDIQPREIEPSMPNLVPSMSVTTATRLNVPNQPLMESNLSVVSVSKYAPSHWHPGDEALDFPEAPRHLLEEKFFECPYCFTLCPTKTLGQEAWKAHLIHDLRPYICTYQHCNNPDQLYDTRQDWVQHESSTHRRIFNCPEHPDEVFYTLGEFQEHLRDGHPDSNAAVPESLIIQTCESTLASPDRCCPICLLSVETMKGLQNHIALHLERFSLFSIPKYTCEGDEKEAGSKQGNEDFEGSRDGDFESLGKPLDSQADILDEDPKSMSQALRLEQRGLYDEARLCYRRLLDYYEKTLGSDSAQALFTVSATAAFLVRRGNNDEAISWYTRALAGYELFLDSRNPITSLGTYKSFETIEEIVASYENARADYERILDSGHPAALEAMSVLAESHLSQENPDRALILYEKALSGYEQVFGPDHPATYKVARNITRCFETQPGYGEGGEWSTLAHRALKIMAQPRIETQLSSSPISSKPQSAGLEFPFPSSRRSSLSSQTGERISMSPSVPESKAHNIDGSNIPNMSPSYDADLKPDSWNSKPLGDLNHSPGYKEFSGLLLIASGQGIEFTLSIALRLSAQQMRNSLFIWRSDGTLLEPYRPWLGGIANAKRYLDPIGMRLYGAIAKQEASTASTSTSEEIRYTRENAISHMSRLRNFTTTISDRTAAISADEYYICSKRLELLSTLEALGRTPINTLLLVSSMRTPVSGPTLPSLFQSLLDSLREVRFSVRKNDLEVVDLNALEKDITMAASKALRLVNYINMALSTVASETASERANGVETPEDTHVYPDPPGMTNSQQDDDPLDQFGFKGEPDMKEIVRSFKKKCVQGGVYAVVIYGDFGKVAGEGPQLHISMSGSVSFNFKVYHHQNYTLT